MTPGIYIMPNGKLCIFQKTMGREEFMIGRFKDDFFGRQTALSFPYDIIYAEEEGQVRFIPVDEKDAEFLLEGFEYLGRL